MFNSFYAIDLFSGCGGLTEGMRQAGFTVTVAIENDPIAAECYRSNHPNTYLFNEDIRRVRVGQVAAQLNKGPLHLLAGCPPCQGFSSVRRYNRKKPVKDKRNTLIKDYFRLVQGLAPLTIMMENVPGITDYYLFKNIVRELKGIGYHIDYDVVDVSGYGVPQSRERLVLVGSLLGRIEIAAAPNIRRTVRDAIGGLESPSETTDPLHSMLPTHSERIQKMIRLIPRNGGSRKDLPTEYHLECHKKENVGFNDIYGRLRWDDFSSTITSGCLNPSKGRFLHPDENRVITPREASLFQTFPRYYEFPTNINKAELALMIGNALPPLFSYYQASHIFDHLATYYG